MLKEDKRIEGEQRFWNKVAGKYDNWIKNAFEEQYKVYRQKISSYIQQDDVVLEIGTGTGDIAFNIAPNCRKVVGIDITPGMIDVARRKNEELNLDNIKFSVEDAYDLTFHNESFTKVISCNSLQVMKEPEKAIMEGKRVLVTGGEFISITYCYGDSGFFEQLKLIKWILLYGIPEFWLNFKTENLIQLFKNAGFEIIEKEIIWEKPVVLFLRCMKV